MDSFKSIKSSFYCLQYIACHFLFYNSDSLLAHNTYVQLPANTLATQYGLVWAKMAWVLAHIVPWMGHDPGHYRTIETRPKRA
jgi:hypothetical protein